MIDIMALQPGMKVKVIDEWVPGCKQNRAGEMDKYLGTFVTVLDVRGDTILIEEDAGECIHQDGGHWYWNAHCFDYILNEDGRDFEPSSESEILSLIFQN